MAPGETAVASRALGMTRPRGKGHRISIGFRYSILVVAAAGLVVFAALARADIEMKAESQAAPALALASPCAPGAECVPGWTLERAEKRPSYYSYVLRGADGAVIEVRFQPRGGVAAGLASTERFDVMVVSRPGERLSREIEAAARGLADVVRRNEGRAGSREAKGERRITAGVVNAILAALWVVFAVLGLAALPAAARALRGVGAFEAGLFVFAVAVAAAFRAAVSPHEFLHLNRHGYTMMAQAMSPDYINTHGNAWPMFFHLIFKAAPKSDMVVFAVNTALATASVGVLYFIALDMFGGAREAFWSALLFAVTPLHLRFSGSEDQFILGSFLFLIVIAAFQRYLKTCAGRWVFLCAAAASLMIQEYRIYFIFPVVLGLMWLFTAPERLRALKNPALWAAVAAFAVVNLPHIIFAATTTGEYQYAFFSDPETIERLARRTAVFFQAEYTPGVFPALLAVGALAGVFTRTRQTLFIAVCMAMFGYALLHSPYQTHILRTQMSYVFFPLLLCGLGAGFVTETEGVGVWRRVVARVVFAGLVAAALSTPFRYRAMIAAPMNQWEEARFLRESAKRFAARPPRAIVTLDTSDAKEDDLVFDFPLYYFERGGARPELTGISGLATGRVGPGGGVLYYEGLSCYGYTFEPPDAFRPACARVRRDFRLRPVFTREFDALPDEFLQIPAKRISIGFYELEKR